MAATTPHKLQFGPAAGMASAIGLRVTPSPRVQIPMRGRVMNLRSPRVMCVSPSTIVSQEIGADQNASELLIVEAPAKKEKLVSRFTVKASHDKGEIDGCSSSRVRVFSAALGDGLSRRKALGISGAGLWCLLLPLNLGTEDASANEFADMPALRGKDYGKSKMRFPDYIETSSGLQYKDLREGVGPAPEQGDQVMVDWAGYTIGYYGRIFEARNKAKGGSFEGNERDYFKFRVGNDEVIPAFEEAIRTMRVGGVRRVIVPPELGYPNNDYNTKGPKPATFSGQRALDFVLKNQGLIDKTLLFDIELLKVNKNT